MPDVSPSALDSAVSAVPAERFHGVDGRAVRPCTPADVTYRHLHMLEVPQGANVLDIGLGSGLSAALLAQLAGPGGQVTAVEIDPGLATRAEALYGEHGHRVGVVVGDGLLGHPDRAPYDRILAGVTPPAVPDAWLRQLKPGGVLLCGVRISGLPGGHAIARITARATGSAAALAAADGERHGPYHVTVHQGGYMPMTVPEQWADVGVDAVTRAVDPERPERSLTLLGAHDPATAAALCAALTSARHTEATPVTGGDWHHLKNWLMATAPDGLLEATLDHGTGVGLGLTAPGGARHAALITGLDLIADDAYSPALEALTGQIHRWRALGGVRTHELPARAQRDGDMWHIRLDAGE
jgi:protein-L-isoaspartate(D-aspartate) O-methyltransferase